jgi:hypothetical protein
MRNISINNTVFAFCAYEFRRDILLKYFEKHILLKKGYKECSVNCFTIFSSEFSLNLIVQRTNRLISLYENTYSYKLISRYIKGIVDRRLLSRLEARCAEISPWLLWSDEYSQGNCNMLMAALLMHAVQLRLFKHKFPIRNKEICSRHAEICINILSKELCE